MRRHHHLLQAVQGVVGRRLRLEDVEGGARHLAGAQGPIRALSTTRPPRAQLMILDAAPHAGDRRGIDDVAGLVGERRVQRDEIGPAQQLLEFTFSTPSSMARSADRYGSKAITFILSPSARSATIEPILPQPMMPSDLL